MNQVSAEILTIGDEILFGQIIDTNSQWISFALDQIGVKVVRKTTVGDNEKAIMGALEAAGNIADIILITGGLGPTNDDITRPCLAKYFDSPISLHPQALKELTEMFENRGFVLNETNRRQAELPEKCTMISNKHGTAPAMWFEQEGKIFVSMPGVPFEMKALMTEEIIPRIQGHFQIPTIRHRMIMTAGIGESWLADKIKDWENNLPANVSLAYLPGIGQVRLRLTGFGNSVKDIDMQLQCEVNKLIPLIDNHLFGYDEITLEATIGKLLTDKSLSVATAESCTGGYIAHLITSVAGSSNYFNGGLVPYQNDMKIKQLGVKAVTLEKYGAVSEQTVKEMAENVREKFNASIGLASTGIAGPGGGTPTKPVGTVWIAYSDGRETITKKLQLGKLRDINIQRTAISVLYLLWQSLSQKNREK